MRSTLWSGAWAAALLLGLAPAALADRALVIGINDYPALKNAALEGSVNDARDMAEALRKQGFSVRVLTNAEATREAVLNALEEERKAIRPNERFVFYFAGHGTRTREKSAMLLLHDAAQKSEENDLSAEVLYEKVSRIEAASRTVLLDSCFSGGMWRSVPGVKSLRPGLRTRFYARDIGGGAKDLFEVEANQADVAHGAAAAAPSIPDPRVCYFTASKENEQAAEDIFDGRAQGVFTRYLLAALAEGRSTWGELQRFVSARVSDHVQDLQHPFLSPQFVDRTVFDNKPAPAGNSKPLTMWDDLHADRPAPERVQLEMVPNRTTIRIGEVVSFNARVGADGYLVILERGTSDRYNLLYPKSAGADDARVNAGSTIRIPDGARNYQAGKEGHERIRVLLFADRPAAERLLSQFRQTRSIERRELRGRLSMLPSEGSRVYTSDIIFEVRPASELD